jgi:hypothetical protein
MSQVLWREESDMQLMRARETTIDLQHRLAHPMGQTNTAIWIRHAVGRPVISSLREDLRSRHHPEDHSNAHVS